MADSSDSAAASEQFSGVDMETEMNLALLDPPRFGWSVTGGIVDVLPPQERARRSSTKTHYIKTRKDRERRKETAARKRKEQEQAAAAGQEQHSLPASLFTLKDPPKGAAAATAENGGTNQMNGYAGQTAVVAVAASAQGAASEGVLPNDGKMSAEELAAFNNGNITGAINGLSQNAQGTVAGLAAFLMQQGALASSSAKDPPQTAGATENGPASHAAASEPILATINNDSNTSIIMGATALDETYKPAAVDTLASAAATDTTNAANNKEASNSEQVIKIKALKSNGILDIYTYHRGREGLEHRDEESGQLLCDVPPTDTNHGWEPPNMKLSISVSFPLGEMQYSDVIEWDLADPKTRTPMCFATNVSEEFGLDVDQTFALAESIQKQIDFFVQSKVSYKSPLTLLDSNGQERSGASVHSPNMRGPPQLYGSAIGETKAGMPIPQRLLQTTKTGRALGYEPSLERAVGDFDPIYREEVLRRAREASRKGVAEKWPNGVVGRMEVDEEGTCHACRRGKMTWCLPCGNQYHTLCSRHIASMLGIFVEDGDEPIVDYCPICALKCDCRQCSKKLSNACGNLQSICIEHGVSPDQVSGDDLFLPRALAGTTRTSQRATRKERRSSGRFDFGYRVSVPKVPASDFPREVCGGRDVDPGTDNDYRTVYSAEGTFLQTDSAPSDGDAKLPAAVPPSNEPYEDGNVDYCHTCMKAGNLLCCDFCPRAFHPECITSEEPTNGDEAWECFVCRREKETTDDDLVDGQSSLDLLVNIFADVKHSDGIDTALQALSLIHATLSKLMEYDFGHLFKEPVDCDLVPNYKAIVKNPMDLGTISTNIVNGKYMELFQENQSWDDVLVAVLKDIELVWHNCFTFNFEGSSVYRMAEVQRRKYQKIRKRNFESLLTSETKARVEEYVAECNLARSKIRGLPKKDRRHNSRNKIAVRSWKRTNKVLGILDPDTGLIVKMYNSFKGATLAAQFLLGLGHPMEFTSLSDLSEHYMKKIVQASAKNSNVLLFGYRWLYMEDLVLRKVKFGSRGDEGLGRSGPSPNDCTVEVKQGNDSHVFLSIEESLSWAGLPNDVSLDEVRQKLLEMPSGDWTTICGLSWRKTKQRRRMQNGSKEAGLVDISKYPVHPTISFVREDLITRRVLAGFESEAAAYADWLEMRQTSALGGPADEPQDLEYFKLYYLDGERNVDGLIWRASLPPEPIFSDAESSSDEESSRSSRFSLSKRPKKRKKSSTKAKKEQPSPRARRYRENASSTQVLESRLKRRSDDGTFKALTEPRMKEDGTYARPCGRAPAGFVWDEITGIYRAMNVAAASHLPKSLHAIAASSRDDSSPPKREMSQAASLPPKRETPRADSLPPKRGTPRADAPQPKRKETPIRKRQSFVPRGGPPKKRDDGTYARPCGRAPEGLVWDEVAGQYVTPSKLGRTPCKWTTETAETNVAKRSRDDDDDDVVSRRTRKKTTTS